MNLRAFLTLLGYTDGVTEATSANEELFTQKRLEETIAEGNESAVDMISNIQTN